MSTTKRYEFGEIPTRLLQTACPGKVFPFAVFLPPVNSPVIDAPKRFIACDNFDARLQFGFDLPPLGFAVPPPLPPPCGAPADFPPPALGGWQDVPQRIGEHGVP
jgi:hypothetical protein